MVVANNGQEVLNILNNQTFDVILMDDNMPLLTGIEATQVIRREEKQTGLHVPIIAMTANTLQGDREECLRAGMDDYICKPVNLEELVNLLEKWAIHSNTKV